MIIQIKKLLTSLLLLGSLVSFSLQQTSTLTCNNGSASIIASVACPSGTCMTATGWVSNVPSSTYSCIPSGYTCPVTQTGSTSYGTVITCCKTNNCNVGNAAFSSNSGLNCYTGTSLSSVSLSSCTGSCVITTIWTANVGTSTYSCSSSCTPSKTGSPVNGLVVTCCTTSNCNTGLATFPQTISSSSSYKKSKLTLLFASLSLILALKN